jgi:hypothetical protein
VDLKHLGPQLAALTAPVQLVVRPASDESPLGSQLADLASRIEEAAGGAVSVRREEGAALPALPGLTLACRDREPITYLASPEGHQAAPFGEALLDLPECATTEAETRGLLADLREPVELLVFVATGCPHCPHAVRAANRLALDSPFVTTTIVDAQWFPELAERYAVRSVPVTLVDRALTILEVVPPEALAKRILSRADPGYGIEVFQSLVEAGRHTDAAAQIIERSGGKAFVAVWKGTTTFERVPLLIVAEEVLDADPTGLDDLVPDLLPVLEAPDGALRGDTADLLGQIGHSAAAAALEALLTDPNPDVAEVAADALEEIREREEGG